MLSGIPGKNLIATLNFSPDIIFPVIGVHSISPGLVTVPRLIENSNGTFPIFSIKKSLVAGSLYGISPKSISFYDNL